MIAGAAAALISAPAIAGGHGGGKKMQKNCAAKLERLEKKGLKSDLLTQARKRLKAGDEKGCLELVGKAKKAMGGGYGKGYGKH